MRPEVRELGWVAGLRKEGMFGVKYPSPALLFRVGCEASGEGVSPSQAALRVGLPFGLLARPRPMGISVILLKQWRDGWARGLEMGGGMCLSPFCECRAGSLGSGQPGGWTSGSRCGCAVGCAVACSEPGMQ